MKKLAFSSDILLPNITEAALLTGSSYREQYDCAYIEKMLYTFHAQGVPTVVLTGVSYEPECSGVVISENGKISYYRHEKIDKMCHGAGDIYSSSFTGAYLSGKTIYDAAVIAADFTLSCIKNTLSDPDHWYGVKFEPVLSQLIEKLNNK